MSNFDVTISYTEDDLKKIQNKPNLYLQQYGSLGAFHLFKEGGQNGYDELEDENCAAYLKSIKEIKRKLKVLYDRMIDKITIEDNGRGIPEDDYPIDISCTKIQSGSKFQRDQGGATSGEFGVGITVVNALSKFFSLTTYRGSYYHRIEFENGEKVRDEKRPTTKGGKKHGTILSFIPNQKYLGKDAHIPIDEVENWLNLQSYLIRNEIDVTLEIWNGMEKEKTKKFKKKDFGDMILEFISDPKKLLSQPMAFSDSCYLEEDITKQIVDKNGKVREQTKKMKKNVELEFAFAYDGENMEADYISFCNFTKTDDHGVHVDAVEEALNRFLQQKVKDSMTEKQREKTDILKQDIKAGLKLVVNLSTNAQVEFMGNAKTKIRNEKLKPLIKEMVTKQLEVYFEKESGKLNNLVRVVKDNAKARIEAQKAKSVNVSKRFDAFAEYDISNFIKCNNTGKAYKEIFLIEGRKSAAGSMVNGRDAATQAIFGFRGVTANAFKMTLADIMMNAEWKAYVKVLHTGIGPNFDLARLYYDKIIIGTDADIDGYGISVGIAGFHVKNMPQIVEAGRLYKVYPPLYHIADSVTPFVSNKAELTEIYLKKIINNFKIRVAAHRGTDYLKKDGFWTFLYNTINYLETLDHMHDFYKVDSSFCEVLALGLTRYGAIDETNPDEPRLKEEVFEKPEFVRDFMSEVQKKYPEVHLDGQTVRGVVNGAMKSLHISQRFVKKMSDLIPVFDQYDYNLYTKEKNCEERLLTIGEFLTLTSRLTPKILSRFKGLGEADADQLWATTLNPEHRTLVRLTFDDFERDYEIFMKLKSDKPFYQAQRKKMIESYRLHREDIDN